MAAVLTEAARRLLRSLRRMWRVVAGTGGRILAAVPSQEAPMRWQGRPRGRRTAVAARGNAPSFSATLAGPPSTPWRESSSTSSSLPVATCLCSAASAAGCARAAKSCCHTTHPTIPGSASSAPTASATAGPTPGTCASSTRATSRTAASSATSPSTTTAG